MDPAADSTRPGSSWVSWLIWPLGLILTGFLTWLVLQSGAVLFADAVTPASSETIAIRTADFVVADSTTLPPDDAGWQPASLPHRVAKADGTDLLGYWYRAGFNLAPSGPLSGTVLPLWLYLPKLSGGGAVYLNDELVGAMPSADFATHVRLLYPHLLLLPPSALHAGANKITLHFASREPRTSVGSFEIGPERALRPKFEQRLFIETTTAGISTAACLVVGMGLLAFWLRRPQEHLYGSFALCLLFWGERTLMMRWPIVPIAYLVHWRLAYYAAHSGFIVLMSISTLRFSQQRNPRLERLLITYAIAGCLLFAIVGTRLRGVMDTYWQIPFFLSGLYCLAQLVLFAGRQRARSSFAMGMTMLLALGLSMHDFAVQEDWFQLIDIDLMHLGIPVFLLVIAGMLLERFLDSLRQAELVNERLALQVSQRECELACSYERLSQLERAQGAAEERQRIMQDMHDGVGSQLLSAMAIIERGGTNRTDTMALLQECLDDMRLAIDSMAPDDPDLLPAFGNFRFRMQARFAGVGISLQWRSHDMPDSLELGTHAGLQILRILQEALANVLKHAQALNVAVDLHFTAQRLLIRVADDGIGFAQGGKHGGRGLANMQNRADKLGASLMIEYLATGTAVQLKIPLASAAAACATVLDR